MADGIYVGMSGAVARGEQLDAIADNLANAQTPGFTQGRAAFESFLPASGGNEKSYTAAVARGTDLTAGPKAITGNPLDIAPEAGAFLSVLRPDGTTAFTRDGRLQVSPDGQLHLGGGQVLNREGKPIVVPPHAVTSINHQGAVLSNGQPQDQLGLFALDGPMTRVGAALLAPGPSGSARLVDSGVQIGALEQSNAKALDLAVQLVSAQRHFDTSMQAIQTYRRLDERANELGRVR
jgi:flagellar basal-body rod protein FlgF